MKRLHFIAIGSIILLLLSFRLSAQVKNFSELTVVVPAETIAKFIQPLLPYEIDFGKNFSGSFWIKSIENIKIDKDRVSFASHIYGKDIKYLAKIGNHKASILVGDVDLQNQWKTSLYYDKTKRKLILKPYIDGPKNKKDLSEGDLMLNALLEALSDIEYPIEADKLKPITSEFYGQVLTINTQISDIYADDNKLFIELIPTAQIIH